MDDPLDRVYRKTELARSELGARTRSLHGTARTVLILVDGRSSVRALTARLGHDAAAALAELARAGYVEEALPPAAPPARVPPPSPPSPLSPPAPMSSPPPEAALSLARREALARLTPHFGPDVEIVARPLLQATDREAFNAGLDQIERKLALYLGKAQAARELADLRQPAADIR